MFRFRRHSHLNFRLALYQQRAVTTQTPALGAIVAIFALLVSSGAFSLLAQETIVNNTYKNTGGTSIEVQSVFDGALPKGFSPMQVTIRNQTTSSLDFQLSLSSGDSYSATSTYLSQFLLRAEPTSETVHQILVPISPAIERGGYQRSSGRITINASGLPQVASSFGDAINRDWPAIGISTALAKRNLSELTTIYKKGSTSSRSGGADNEFALRFDAKMLPADWRGYSGLDALMLTTVEWEKAGTGVQQAILEWVRLGGRLALFTDSDVKLEALGVTRGQRSRGSIERYQWKNETLNASEIYAAMKKSDARVKRSADEYKKGWNLQDTFPSKGFNTPLIVILLITFGVVVGPLNLFVFAKQGKRHRLFVTTPLISITASVLISLLILFSDGIGGVGSRQLFIDLQPDPVEKKAYVVQEQFTRAGVLLKSAFEINESAVLIPVQLRNSRWYRGPADTISKTGNTFSGDWFSSRSEQAQIIEAVRPTRSRIELRKPANGDAPPQLFSSVDFTLGALHYIDDKGAIWKVKSDQVNAGESIDLVATDRKAFKKWWSAATGSFSRSQFTDLAGLANQRGVFFAESKDPRVGFIETLPGIRWNNDRAVVHGRVLAAAGTAATETPDPGEAPTPEEPQ